MNKFKRKKHKVKGRKRRKEGSQKEEEERKHAEVKKNGLVRINKRKEKHLESKRRKIGGRGELQ